MEPRGFSPEVLLTDGPRRRRFAMTDVIRRWRRRNRRVPSLWSPAVVLVVVLAFGQLTRQATTISGRVLDASSNEPLAGATVLMALIDAPPGTSAPVPVVTNDRGEFSFVDLPAGRYSLWARKPRYLSLSYGQRPGSGLPGVSVMLTAGQPVKDVVIRLPLASVIAGMITDARGEPAQGETVQVLRLEWRNGERGARALATDTVDDRGHYRIPNLPPGDYLVVAHVSATGSVRPAPTYYPGTPVPTLAIPITLGVSEERAGVNVQTSAMVLSTVTGTIAREDGRPVRNTRIAATQQVSALRGFFSQTTYSTADGRFRIDNLPPGRHELLAREEPNNAASGLWATAEVIADGNPIKDVVLVLREGETVSGKLVVEGTKPLTFNAQLTLSPLDRDPSNSASFSARPDPEGRFSMTGVLPGRYVLIASDVSAGYLIRSVQLDGAEVGDLPIEVGSSRQIQGLDVRLSPNGASVAGTLFDADGRPNSDLLVIVFPADDKYWLPGSTRVRTARPATDGKYSVRSLPPGSYRVGVVIDAEPGEWFARPFLQKLAPTAIAISLSGGESRTLDVRVK